MLQLRKYHNVIVLLQNKRLMRWKFSITIEKDMVYIILCNADICCVIQKKDVLNSIRSFNLWSYDSIFIFYSQFVLYFLIIWLKGNTRWLADKLNVNVLLKPAKNVVSALKIIDIMKLIFFYWNCACFNLWIHLALNAITWYKPICHWILTY